MPQRPAAPTVVPSSGERRLRVLLAVLVVIGVAFAISEYSTPPVEQGWLRRFAGLGAFLPLQLGAAWALYQASRRSELPGGVRAGLQLLAAAFMAFAAGTSANLGQMAFGGTRAYYSWTEPLYLLHYPLLVAGLLRLPRVPRAGGRVRAALDLAIVVGAFGLLLAIGERIDESAGVLSRVEQMFNWANSVAYLAGLVALNIAVTRARRTPKGPAFTVLLAALAISLLGDTLYEIVYAAGFGGVNWSIATAIVTNLLVVYAGLRFVRDPIDESPDDGLPVQPFSLLPMIAMAAVAVDLFMLAARGLMTGLQPLTLALVLLTLILAGRDVLTLRLTAAALRAEGKREAEREAERRLDALVRYGSDSFLALGPGGVVAFARGSVGAHFGREPAGVEGLPLAALALPADAVPLETFLERLRTTPGEEQRTTWRARHPDGTVRSLESSGVDLVDEPAVRALVLTTRDVTDRLELEEQLRQALKLEAVGQLAGGVAHDFNNILTAILGGAEIASVELPEGHPVARELAEIRAAAQRGAALATRLLRTSRRSAAEPRRVDLAELVRAMRPLLDRLAGEQLRVELDLPAEPLACRVDPSDMEHALVNLVANARDAARDGGAIRVQVSRADVTTPLHGALLSVPPGPHVRLLVSDDGVGMDPGIRSRMLEPFFTTKAPGRGTGLGLAGLRRMLEPSGGMTVDSEPGCGTSIALYLPEVPDQAEGSGEARPRRSESVGLRVLVVDDDPAVLSIVARLLAARGCKPAAVTSAAQAREQLSGDHPPFDVVVSDVMMPGETGTSLAAWIGRRHPGLPVVLMSAHLGDASRAASPGLDLGQVLKKPFSVDALLDRIESVRGA
jgi:PAS domain S-box-containing protein